MVSDKAIYWLAVGVVALGLNSTYQQGEFCWAHKLADHAVLAAEHAAERGLTALSMAEVMIGRDPGDIARLQGALARLEARSESLPRVESQPDLEQAQLDLEQMNVDLEGLNRAVQVNVPCPQARQLRHRMVVMAGPQMKDGELVVNGTTVDLKGLQSLQALDGLRSMQSMRGLESLRSLESMRSLRDFQFSFQQVPSGRVQIKVHNMKSSDGTI